MQISDEVIKILEYLGKQIGVTIDWASNSVLPYAEQLCKKFVEWETNTSFAWIVFAGISIVLGLIYIIVACCLAVGYPEINWLIFGGIVFLAFIIIGTQVFDIIECKTFPEKAIYDYIQVHMSGGS